MRIHLALGLFLSSSLVAALVWGQTEESNLRTKRIVDEAGNYAQRESELTEQLRRLRSTESTMGANHPQLANVRQRIGALETELTALRSVPNPFKQFEDEGISPRDIVDRLSEKELRTLVVRLAVDVKELRSRVADLERATR